MAVDKVPIRQLTPVLLGTLALSLLAACAEPAPPVEAGDGVGGTSMEPDTVAREATPADASAALNFDCSSEFADCLTGGVYGDGSCADITPCVQACDSAGQDADCQRDCYSQASQEAVQHDLEVQLCTRLHCDTEPELTGCATAAVAEGGPCHALFLTCATADPDRSGD